MSILEPINNYLKLFFALLILATGCTEPGTTETHAYIGGEIINPNKGFVVLTKNGTIQDTISLDQQNRFSYRLDSVESGLYLIQHFPETQNVYLEPGDSLLLRANTMAFDESLHFSGRGDARNNFMAEMYLLDEENSNLLLSFYKNKPVDFLKKTDSILKKRMESLEKTAAKRKFSPEFVELARKIIHYENYDLLERYSYLVNKYYKEYGNEIPEDFHKYRKQVQFNDEAMQSSPAYRRYIDNYLINRSLKWCARQTYDEDECNSLTDVKNIMSRIRMVDNLIHLPSLKNHFFSKLGSQAIVMSKSQSQIDQILQLLESKGYPEDDLENLSQLGSIQVAYLPGTRIQNVSLHTFEGDSISIKKIYTKPTVVFLWSVYHERHTRDHEKIQDLREKYPEINFVGINIDVGEPSVWKNAIQKNNYNREQNFQLGDTGIERRFFDYYLGKLVFLDKTGEVIVGNMHFDSSQLESRILEFMNTQL